MESILDHNSYRDLVSGAKKGFLNDLYRFGLRLISIGYSAGVRLRNFSYELGLSKSYKSSAGVISIGNITTGGTGKTPLVVWVCRLLQEKDIPCSVLTRGYMEKTSICADEPALLAKACPEAGVVVNPERVQGAKKAVEEFGSKILVMDDGFQHRRLRRDLDIVAIDATCPFGYGHVLPAGLLREPVSALRRALGVVITRYDQSEAVNSEKLVKQIQKAAPGAVIAKAAHRHSCAKTIKGVEISLEELKERKIFAFCGVGNPGAFLGNLDSYGFDVVGSKVFNDHHDYTEEDISQIYGTAKEAGADMILSTEKDWVKIALPTKEYPDIVFAYLVLELDFIDGGDKIESLVDRVITNYVTTRGSDHSADTNFYV